MAEIYPPPATVWPELPTIAEGTERVWAQPMEARMAERSFGERAVGMDFNPSADPRVAHLKQLFAKVIDELDELRAGSKPGELARLCSIAITEAQGAQMWAVKAATWRHGVEDGRAP